jgi:hypothetical protein
MTCLTNFLTFRQFFLPILPDSSRTMTMSTTFLHFCAIKKKFKFSCLKSLYCSLYCYFQILNKVKEETLFLSHHAYFPKVHKPENIFS